jgi:hypothetical protein
MSLPLIILFQCRSRHDMSQIGESDHHKGLQSPFPEWCWSIEAGWWLSRQIMELSQMIVHGRNLSSGSYRLNSLPDETIIEMSLPFSRIVRFGHHKQNVTFRWPLNSNCIIFALNCPRILLFGFALNLGGRKSCVNLFLRNIEPFRWISVQILPAISENMDSICLNSDLCDPVFEAFDLAAKGFKSSELQIFAFHLFILYQIWCENQNVNGQQRSCPVQSFIGRNSCLKARLWIFRFRQHPRNKWPLAGCPRRDALAPNSDSGRSLLPRTMYIDR